MASGAGWRAISAPKHFRIHDLSPPAFDLDGDPPSSRYSFPLLILALLTAGLAFGAVPVSGETPPERGSSAYLWALAATVGAAWFLGLLFMMVQTALGAQVVAGQEDDDNSSVPREEAHERTFERVCWSSSLFANLVAIIAAMEWMRAAYPERPWLAVAAAVVTVLLQFVLLENVARGVAINWAEDVLRYLRAPVALISTPLRPILAVVLSISPKNHAWTAEARSRYIRDREMRLLPHVKGVDRLVEEEAVDMIDSVREFSESTASDVMTPRTDIEGVPRDLAREELFQRLKDTARSRLVVYDGNLDNVIGVLLAKEVLLEKPDDPYSLLRPSFAVSHDTSLPDLLRDLRRRRNTLAVVIDEFGGTAGIVTLHDLFEQVIGAHISDEEDEEELWIDPQADGSVLLSGRVELWEINQELDLNLDEASARTIGGFLMTKFGRLPDPGEQVQLAEGVLVVEAVQDNRILSASFHPGRVIEQVAEVLPEEQPQ